MPPYSEIADEWPVQRQEIRIPSRRRITPSPSSSSSPFAHPLPSPVPPLPSFRLRDQDYNPNPRAESLPVRPTSIAIRSLASGPHHQMLARDPFLELRDENIVDVSSNIRKRDRETASNLRYDEEEDDLRALHRRMQLQRLREQALQRLASPQESLISASNFSSNSPMSHHPTRQPSIPSTRANIIQPSNSFRNLRTPGFSLSSFSSSIRSPSSASSSSSSFFENSAPPLERRQIFREKSIPFSIPLLPSSIDESSTSSEEEEEEKESLRFNRKEDSSDDEFDEEILSEHEDMPLSNDGVSSDGIPYMCLLEDMAARYQLRQGVELPQDDDDIEDDDDDEEEEEEDQEQDQRFRPNLGLLKDMDQTSSSSSEEEEDGIDELVEEAQFPTLAQLFMTSERQISKKPFPTKPQSNTINHDEE